MFKDNLDRVLKYIKKSKKISQAQIAEMVGITPSGFTDWLKGRGSPSPEKITKLAEVLGVAVSDLIDEPPLPEPIPPILFSVSEKKPHQSEADQEFSKLSEEDKRLALSFLKFIKENNLTYKK